MALHGFSETMKALGNIRLFGISQAKMRPVVEALPVQVGFRTMGNHWKFNIFVALSHVSIHRISAGPWSSLTWFTDNLGKP